MLLRHDGNPGQAGAGLVSSVAIVRIGEFFCVGEFLTYRNWYFGSHSARAPTVAVLK